MRNAYTQSTRKVCELALGPLRWRFASCQDTRDSDVILTPDDFLDALRDLVAQALNDGCSPAEVNAILGQYTHGDHHVDA